MNKKIRKIILLSLLPALLIIYFSYCTILYFFEPISYYAPDLSHSDFSFEFYNKFAYDKNDQFYIRQISYNDIVSAPEDIRLKYVENTIIAIADDSVSFDEMTSLANSVDGTICGYIEIIDFYQISFSEKSYDELINICSVLSNNSLIEIAIPDYFEETPVAETTSEAETGEYYYHNIMDSYSAWTLPESMISEITIGMIDVPVYSEHRDLNVVNASDYSNDLLLDDSIMNAFSHGTHVAGIMSAAKNSKTPGIAAGAGIYSENGINTSLSYWLASIVNMIVNQDINVINISMGYNSYIPVSASLGCEFALEFIENENEFFESALRNLIEKNYEFLICLAAGNETGNALYKTNSGLFSYCEKEKLDSLDIFNIFASKPEYCNSEYQFLMTNIDDTDVRNRIMIVGCCDSAKKYSPFASYGNNIDIVAPGEMIYNTGYREKYEYMTGTSMSAPFVAATASILFELDENLTGAQVKDIIIKSSYEKISVDGFLYPILDVGNSIEYVKNKQIIT